MKKNNKIGSIFIIALMLLLGSCGESGGKKTVAGIKINIGSQIGGVAGSDGGGLLYGTSGGSSFGIVLNNQNDIELNLNNGPWSFQAIVWDSDNLEGVVKCSTVDMNLDGGNVDVNFDFQNSFCANGQFGPTFVEAGNVRFPRINFHTCSDITAATVNCNSANDIGLTKSFRLDFLSFKLNIDQPNFFKDVAGPKLSGQCFDLFTALSETSTNSQNLNVPISFISGFLVTDVVQFFDTGCGESIPPTITPFDFGVGAEPLFQPGFKKGIVAGNDFNLLLINNDTSGGAQGFAGSDIVFFPQISATSNNAGDLADHIFVTWKPIELPNISNHEVSIFSDSSCETLVETKETGSINNFYDLVSLDATLVSGEYYAQITAINSNGNEFTTECSSNGLPLVIDVTAPAQNVNPGITGTIAGGPIINVTWAPFTDSEDNIVDHRVISYSNASCSPESEVIHPRTGTSGNSASLSGLRKGSYKFIIKAYDIAGNTAQTTCADSPAVSLNTSPGIPRDFTIQNVSSSSLKVSFTAEEEVNEYVLFWSDNPNGTSLPPDCSSASEFSLDTTDLPVTGASTISNVGASTQVSEILTFENILSPQYAFMLCSVNSGSNSSDKSLVIKHFSTAQEAGNKLINTVNMNRPNFKAKKILTQSDGSTLVLAVHEEAKISQIYRFKNESGFGDLDRTNFASTTSGVYTFEGIIEDMAVGDIDGTPLGEEIVFIGDNQHAKPVMVILQTDGATAAGTPLAFYKFQADPEITNGEGFPTLIDIELNGTNIFVQGRHNCKVNTPNPCSLTNFYKFGSSSLENEVRFNANDISQNNLVIGGTATDAPTSETYNGFSLNSSSILGTVKNNDTGEQYVYKLNTLNLLADTSFGIQGVANVTDRFDEVSSVILDSSSLLIVNGIKNNGTLDENVLCHLDISNGTPSLNFSGPDDCQAFGTDSTNNTKGIESSGKLFFANTFDDAALGNRTEIRSILTSGASNTPFFGGAPVNFIDMFTFDPLTETRFVDISQVGSDDHFALLIDSRDSSNVSNVGFVLLDSD
jgi:hypothetical protein